MFGLMPSGRELQEEAMGRYADESARVALSPHYPPFLQLNDDFKQLCTDWQMRNGEPNDHSDAAYDQACVDKLAELNRSAAPVIGAMADGLPRFARYVDRLDRAAQGVAGGDTTKFTGVMCESFHDIWMELHEDLILLQGIDRSAEGSF